MDTLDREVLATPEDDIMRPTALEEAIRLALAELAPERQTAGRRRLEMELRTVRQECERLADAIAAAGPLDVLLERLTVVGRRVALGGTHRRTSARVLQCSFERRYDRLQRTTHR